MSEKWTPGPWSVWDGIQTRGVLTVAQSPNCVVADMWHPPVGTAEANAHLIAAAPDLYEALKAYVAADDNTGNPATSIREYDKNMERARTVALAALSKARGEQP